MVTLETKPTNTPSFEDEIKSYIGKFKKQNGLLFLWITSPLPLSNKITEIKNWQPSEKLLKSFKEFDEFNNK